MADGFLQGSLHCSCGLASFGEATLMDREASEHLEAELSRCFRRCLSAPLGYRHVLEWLEEVEVDEDAEELGERALEAGRFREHDEDGFEVFCGALNAHGLGRVGPVGSLRWRNPS